MAVTERERQVIPIGIVVKSNCRGEPDGDLPNHRLREALDLISRHVGIGGASNLRQIYREAIGGDPEPGDDADTASVVYVKQLRLRDNPSRAELLFHSGNRDLADPAFIDFEDGDVRIEPKGPTEGIGFSAHLVMELIDRGPAPSTKALLERIPGLGRSSVFACLNLMLKIACAREQAAGRFTFTDGRGRHYPYHLSLEVGVVPNESVVRSLTSGDEVLAGIEFLREIPLPDELDEDPQFERAEETRSIIFSKPLSGRRVPELLARLMRMGREANYDRVQFRMKRPDAKVSQQVWFDVTDQEALELPFSKRLLIGPADRVLKQCEDALNPWTLTQMVQLLQDRGLWRRGAAN